MSDKRITGDDPGGQPSQADNDLSKDTIRERVWDELEDSGVARFPFPPHGRIPNFEDANSAAKRLAAQPEWEHATTIKANPDAPQLPVRRRALRDGKTVYMAVPRLRDEECVLKLDPAELDDYDAATTVSGSSTHGEQVGPEAVDKIDLIVSGSVGVRADPEFTPADGGRIGKGEGYSDLEFAVLFELGLVDADTPVATTIHERQLLTSAEAEGLEVGDHDVPMDLVVTPGRVVRPGGGEKPDGLDWECLSEERLAEIPVLERVRSDS
ncbi:thiamine metabolism protein [Natrialba magadii ATCC 43099]|uniref:5-formyltetrahydrofolate cyclo-ligase n=1 Tax=Natrialba magadii (strain ATCC 43099 / DSM 3394 / CCM 3739 / CIP 104546 / IAM 13178 / JCM 8861 / NBRC 102185 / NCIMB 2190 / MS3) TaxID=547559 RepID=D3SZL6_NATMM|nr:5-formyltetrahydrofolate cyclo-ligase [Natrialba magadii]ADD06276.1 thiamine metabolism protein [Natrialba magadii ATCC 43099]ELY31288.1 5-formyltetrahydrofolate cyclo-ligase [Natrialba magadii ATCC 43099]